MKKLLLIGCLTFSLFGADNCERLIKKANDLEKSTLSMNTITPNQKSNVLIKLSKANIIYSKAAICRTFKNERRLKVISKNTKGK